MKHGYQAAGRFHPDLRAGDASSCGGSPSTSHHAAEREKERVSKARGKGKERMSTAKRRQAHVSRQRLFTASKAVPAARLLRRSVSVSGRLPVSLFHAYRGSSGEEAQKGGAGGCGEKGCWGTALGLLCTRPKAWCVRIVRENNDKSKEPHAVTGCAIIAYAANICMSRLSSQLLS